MKKLISILILCACSAFGQDSFSGVLYLSPAYTLTQTIGASVNTLAQGRVLAQTNTFGTNGTAMSPQMNSWFVDSFTLTNSETRTYSLDALTNSFAQAMDLFRANAIIVKVAARTNATGPVTVGGIAAHVAIFGATNETAAIGNGGVLFVSAPDATGWPADGKVLHLANGTNATAVEIYIGGAR